MYLLRRQLPKALFRLRFRVTCRVAIGFYVRFSVRERYSPRLNEYEGLTMQQLLLEQMSWNQIMAFFKYMYQTFKNKKIQDHIQIIK